VLRAGRLPRAELRPAAVLARTGLCRAAARAAPDARMGKRGARRTLARTGPRGRGARRGRLDRGPPSPFRLNGIDSAARPRAHVGVNTAAGPGRCLSWRRPMACTTVLEDNVAVSPDPAPFDAPAGHPGAGVPRAALIR